MTSLGLEAYVNTLNFKELDPPFELPRKKIFFSGYINNIFSGPSAASKYMEWTNKTAIGGGEYITPITFPFKVKLITSTYTWLSTSAMLLTGVERCDFFIGNYDPTIAAGGVGNSSNFVIKGTNINTFTSADNNTYPKQVIDNSSGGYIFDAGDAIALRSNEQGTITPTNSELQIGLVFEIIP